MLNFSKDVLRQAICDGAFSPVGIAQGQGGPQMQRGQLTPQILAQVADMTDDVLNATLTLYVANKQTALKQQLLTENAKISAINAQIAALPVTPA